MSSELALLQRLVASPYTRRLFWEERPVLGIVPREPEAERLVVRDRGIFPANDEAVDAWIHCTTADLVAMAARRPPPGEVSWHLGDRPGAPRRKQARVLLALAALGWCGPWPDPAAAPDAIVLLRQAWYDLAIGAQDATAPLFPAEGPLPGVTVRLTETAAGTELVTVGLADTIGRPELATLVPGRQDPRGGFAPLRAAALYVAEHTALPARLALGPRTLVAAPHPRLPDGLALPPQLTWLLRVQQE
jgi:hypothetical protein